MNANVTTPVAAADNLAAVQKKVFRVTITTDPAVLGQSPSKYVNILLGTNGSPNATAVLSNFAFLGGTVTKNSMNGGSQGDFTSSITMRCRPGTPPPQVIGQMSATLTQFSFFLALDTSCSTSDWFTLWLMDLGGNSFPTTADGRPGLIASVNWNTSAQFTPAGYQGNGQIDGQSDAGFKATVVPF